MTAVVERPRAGATPGGSQAARGRPRQHRPEGVEQGAVAALRVGRAVLRGRAAASGGLPVIARPDTLRYRAAKFVRRNRGAVAARRARRAGARRRGPSALRGRRASRDRSAARAEQRFDEVRQLANASLFDLHDSIRDLPGSTPARQLLVSKGLEYLDRLSRDAGDRPDLKREMAGAYVKVGDVQGRPFNPNLGDTAGARASYDKAVAIYESLGAPYVPRPLAAPRTGHGVPATQRDRRLNRRHRRGAETRQDGARSAARSRRDVAGRGRGGGDGAGA